MKVSNEILSKYSVVVGLEIHVQLATQSKIFAPDLNSFGDHPNTNISVITLGHPGIMPKLNKKVVEYAIKMGLACNCEINRINHFDRKNYFYPDLPKGYQVTQDKAPICIGGEIPIRLTEGQTKKVKLNRIHMEEDAGKSIHRDEESDTLVDYNRAGVPLIEMVTEPDINSAEEAGAVLAEVRKMVRYLEICDGNMEEGSMRCDANISVKLKESTQLGKKVEVKNMNSVRNVQRAILHETHRQIKKLEAGNTIDSETRTFDDQSGTTAGMRTKEELNDYRYFPEPDLSPLIVKEEWLEEIREKMPALPEELFVKFTSDYGLPEYDAGVITENRGEAEYFMRLSKATENYKAASNWLMGPVKSWLNEEKKEIEDFPIPPEQIAELIELVDLQKVSHSIATKSIFPELLKNPGVAPGTVAKKNNLLQDSDSQNIMPIIEEILEAMPEKVKAYQKGKKGLIGLFMGELMKKSKGKADPKLANELLRKKLENKDS